MSITVKGTIQHRDLGAGAWALVTDDGKTYEIPRNTDKKLLQPGQKVQVTGKLREDIMTTAMIGSVLEVKDFQIL